MTEYYLWLKALHIIAVISWMAGMLYLPRLYVYHADAKPGSELSETLKIMERRLLRFIMNPAMLVVFVLGIMLVMIPGLLTPGQMGWFHVKITLVLGMAAFHGMLAKWRKKFERDANTRAASFYRKVNEIPTVLMIVIVLLAVLKPF